MTEYKTMRVPEDAHEAAQDAKRDGETWGEYLRRCSDNPPEIREFVEAGDAQNGASDEAIVEAVEGLQEEVKDLSVFIERLPDNVADELEGRLR